MSSTTEVRFHWSQDGEFRPVPFSGYRSQANAEQLAARLGGAVQRVTITYEDLPPQPKADDEEDS